MDEDASVCRRYAARRTHNDDAERDMGPSEKSFQQVKSILGKLDRSIDSVRQARLQPGVPAPAAGPTPPPAPATFGPAKAVAAPAPAPASPATQVARPSFGRAQPLPRASNPGGKWL